jgi:hypothetical protein
MLDKNLIISRFFKNMFALQQRIGKGVDWEVLASENHGAPSLRSS